LRISGHAFESRLYAEDVPKGFLPATGTLSHLRFGPGARADSGVRAGDTISPHYDPMIAKLITHGATREIALKQMAQALRETEVAGTVTNLAFLGALCDHRGFATGAVDTGLIGRDLETLVVAPVATSRVLAQAAMVAMDLMQAPGWDRGFALWQAEWRSVVLEVAGEEQSVGVKLQSATSAVIRVGDHEVAALWQDGWRFDGDMASPWARDRDRVTVFAGYGMSFRVVDPLERANAAGGDGNLIEAPMPGLVKAVFAKAGQEVKQGDRLAILEAMKMEHALLAARDGVVAEVLAEAGSQVEAGAALIRLQEDVEAAA
jgi:3-methylcrotonyl-CoA carboxylase alpha subunit